MRAEVAGDAARVVVREYALETVADEDTVPIVDETTRDVTLSINWRDYCSYTDDESQPHWSGQHRQR